MADIVDNGFTVTLTRLELSSLLRALEELRAMQRTHPDFRNGFGYGIQIRVDDLEKMFREVEMSLPMSNLSVLR